MDRAKDRQGAEGPEVRRVIDWRREIWNEAPRVYRVRIDLTARSVGPLERHALSIRDLLDVCRDPRVSRNERFRKLRLPKPK